MTRRLYEQDPRPSDGQGRPLGFVLTGGEASGYNAFKPLPEMPVGRPRLMLADKGYGGDTVRQSLRLAGISPVLPPKANRREPIRCDFRACKDRTRIERMFNKVKQFRRTATRYDKTKASFAAFPNLAAACIWMRDFVIRAWSRLAPRDICCFYWSPRNIYLSIYLT
ncbi:transposase [Stappia indica]|uniref:transposase n=1 Tax=Stappia indica TaxID=538381 RepID=UPI001CD73834|nr:transposase [Stappia indica]MCA1298077.1 transposase [Stappia indica]